MGICLESQNDDVKKYYNHIEHSIPSITFYSIYNTHTFVRVSFGRENENEIPLCFTQQQINNSYIFSLQNTLFYKTVPYIQTVSVICHRLIDYYQYPVFQNFHSFQISNRKAFFCGEDLELLQKSICIKLYGKTSRNNEHIKLIDFFNQVIFIYLKQ